MRFSELLKEGGWGTTATQSTVITPKVVKTALQSLQQFTNDFNKFLASKNVQPVKIGKPTGSSAYHDVDPEDKVYGDIDVQMIGNPIEGLTTSQYSSFYNKLADEFIATYKPKYLHPTDNTTGHPIFKIGPDQYVQVDFMWHSPDLEKWGAARVTPERGVKGSLFGNMFSVLGEILDMSIQHAGVQLKVIDGQKVPFSKQKNTKVLTVSTDPENFILDIFKYLAKKEGLSKVKLSKDFKQNTGTDLQNPKVSKLISGVKALADTLQLNNLFGRGELSNFKNKEDFLNAFLKRYEEKAVEDLEGKKREKATTPQAIERAKQDREKILSGLQMVKQLFGANLSENKGLPFPGTYEQEYRPYQKKGSMQLIAMTTEDYKKDFDDEINNLIKKIWDTEAVRRVAKQPRYLVYGEYKGKALETDSIFKALDKAKEVAKINLDSPVVFYDRKTKFPVVSYKGSEDYWYQNDTFSKKAVNEKWTKKYKKSINCSNPKGFSQKAHCAGRKARQAGKHTKSSSVNEYGEIDTKRKIEFSKENPPSLDYLYQQFLQRMLNPTNTIDPNEWIAKVNDHYGLNYTWKDYQRRGHNDHTNNWQKIINKYILKKS